jgi:hypothetical protein
MLIIAELRNLLFSQILTIKMHRKLIPNSVAFLHDCETCSPTLKENIAYKY